MLFPVPSSSREPRPQAGRGLCADCLHSRRIQSDRGSEFLLCQLSFTDQRFAKYPQLPVLSCSGYQKKTAEKTAGLE
jgi:hypothetical protein